LDWDQTFAGAAGFGGKANAVILLLAAQERVKGEDRGCKRSTAVSPQVSNGQRDHSDVQTREITAK